MFFLVCVGFCFVSFHLPSYVFFFVFFVVVVFLCLVFVMYFQNPESHGIQHFEILEIIEII